MGGTYDPDHSLPFHIYGGHFVVRLNDTFLRVEYLNRRTKMDMGSDPATEFKYGPGPNGTYDPYFDKDGGYAELEFPITRRVTGDRCARTGCGVAGTWSRRACCAPTAR